LAGADDIILVMTANPERLSQAAAIAVIRPSASEAMALP